VRLHILALLLAGKGACCPIDPAKPTIGVCVCEITEHLGLSQSKVSYHLGKLKKVGLIQEERFGKWNHYVVNHQIADDFITAYAGFFSR
jgi:DNA-binding transcriptional ArsR family regulator